MPKALNLLMPYRFVSQDTLVPGYEENGFPDKATAEYWRDRACGIACVQMLLHAHIGKLLPAGHLVEEALALGAYRPGRGWIHAGLAGLLAQYGLSARAELLPEAALTTHMLRGGCAILSVTPTLGVKRPAPQERASRGGHLVLCHGFSVPSDGDLHENPASRLLISDPDHEFLQRLEGALAPFAQVEQAWSGRCIVIEPLNSLSTPDSDHAPSGRVG